MESLLATSPPSLKEIERLGKIGGIWQKLIKGNNLLAGQLRKRDNDVVRASAEEVPREHLDKFQLGCAQWADAVDRWEDILPKRRIDILWISQTRGMKAMGAQFTGERNHRVIHLVGDPRIDARIISSHLRLSVVKSVTRMPIYPRGAAGAAYAVALLRGLRQCTMESITANAFTLSSTNVVRFMQTALESRGTRAFRVMFDEDNPVDLPVFLNHPVALASRKLALHVHASTDISILREMVFSRGPRSLTLGMDVGSASELHEETLELPNYIIKART
ncbi:hypothetical protein AAVH_05595 [Aphelenchoides avenae]|nr:hypothetical protein AAVH_05595 [Aphelenchus avenae]